MQCTPLDLILVGFYLLILGTGYLYKIMGWGCPKVPVLLLWGKVNFKSIGVGCI